VDPALWEELLQAEAGTDTERAIEAVIRFARPGIEIAGVRIISRFGTVATCRIPARDIIAVRARPDVVSLKAARGISPDYEPALGPQEEPLADPVPVPSDLRRSPSLTPTGAGVCFAAVDFGVDVDSAAFQKPPGAAAPGQDGTAPETRFLSFWDQRDQAVGPRPYPYGYGTVHSREDINLALRDPRPYERLGYHPGVADRNGRGTHAARVIDIGAGNGQAGGPLGIAPEADLIFVHLADRKTGGIGTFGNSVRMLEAVDFIARTAGLQPCVINISAGKICGPKDGTTLVERAFDELLEATPGLFIVNTGGNYLQSRAHACGTILPGETRSLTFAIDPTDVTLNELEIWYDGADEFAVRINPPGYTAARPVRLGERSNILVDGRVVGRVYHRYHDPNNGDNHIVAYIDAVGCAGDWTVALEGRRITSGRFHSWIERDDSCPGCQPRFSQRGSNRSTTLGSIATSHLPLIVGAYDAHDPARPPATFSSAGPCRDGRWKPDIVAPGVGVLAARSAPLGASRNAGLLVRGNGTSFAAPHVSGAVALCFEVARGQLSAQDIRALVLGSCDPPPDWDPLFRLGYGYLNIPNLITDVQAMVTSRSQTGEAEDVREAVDHPRAAPTVDRADDIVYVISEIQKPGDVAEFWAGQREHPADWGHPLSALEREYIAAFTDPRTPTALRMRVPVDPMSLTAEERANAERWFKGGDDGARQFANYENRRRIIANYVYKHPATLRLELGLYRLVRDINPIHFALERGWQIGSGREMFTGEDVSRLGAAGEFLLALALVYGVERGLAAARPAVRATPSMRSLTEPIWDLPSEGGGTWINGRWYTEHALERMAPDTPQIRAELRVRARTRLQRLGVGPEHPAYERVMAKALVRIDPRGVPPSVVEAEIVRPGSTGVKVITAKQGRVVVTVVPR
jgi:subtilisin family serine protease